MASFLYPGSRFHTLNSPWFWLSAFVLLNLAVPFLNISSMAIAIVGSLSLTFAYIAIVLCFAATVALRRLSLVTMIGMGVLGLLFWLAMDKWIGPGIHLSLRAELQGSHLPPNTAQLLQIFLVRTLGDLSILIVAVCGGNIAARMINSPNMVGPVCVVIALIDIWGVLFGGIVSQMMEKTPEIAAKAMTKGPMIGAATTSTYAIPMPAIGVGDYLFISLLLGVLVIHHLNYRAAMSWIAGLVCVTLLSISFGVIPYALPGLVPIALGAAIPNLVVFRYTREEKFALIYAGIFVVILTGALYLGFKSMLPADKPGPKQKITI